MNEINSHLDYPRIYHNLATVRELPRLTTQALPKTGLQSTCKVVVSQNPTRTSFRFPSDENALHYEQLASTPAHRSLYQHAPHIGNHERSARLRITCPAWLSRSIKTLNSTRSMTQVTEKNLIERQPLRLTPTIHGSIGNHHRRKANTTVLPHKSTPSIENESCHLPTIRKHV